MQDWVFRLGSGALKVGFFLLSDDFFLDAPLKRQLFYRLIIMRQSFFFDILSKNLTDHFLKQQTIDAFNLWEKHLYSKLVRRFS